MGRLRRFRGAAVPVVAAVVALAWATPAWAASITSPGPLTQIGTSTDLNCSVNHTGDTHGEWFGDTACGTFVAVGGVLYGPASVPAGGGLDSVTAHTAWTPVSQTTGGDGSAATPATITTVVTGGGAVQVTQVDSYIFGQESYSTTATVKNISGAPETLKLYRAGDCFLANNDQGFGRIDTVASGKAPTCVGVDPANPSQPGTRIEQFLPLTPGSNYVEDLFSTVWSDVGSRNDLPNTCTCTTLLDNGMGLSWSMTLAAGASQSFSHVATFSPTGVTPVVAAKTADAGVVLPSVQDGYTVTFHNGNTAAVTLSSITDTLPTGFSYVAGSTTGGITTDPTVTGVTQLQWNGPFSVPAGGDLQLHFKVVVSATPGTYTNTVTGASPTHAVVPASNTAPINVALVVAVPVIPVPGLPVAAATLGLFGIWAWVWRRRTARQR